MLSNINNPIEFQREVDVMTAEDSIALGQKQADDIYKQISDIDPVEFSKELIHRAGNAEFIDSMAMYKASVIILRLHAELSHYIERTREMEEKHGSIQSGK